MADVSVPEVCGNIFLARTSFFITGHQMRWGRCSQWILMSSLLSAENSALARLLKGIIWYPSTFNAILLDRLSPSRNRERSKSTPWDVVSVFGSNSSIPSGRPPRPLPMRVLYIYRATFRRSGHAVFHQGSGGRWLGCSQTLSRMWASVKYVHFFLLPALILYISIFLGLPWATGI